MPQADAIHRVAKRAGILLRAARWATRTMTSWLVVVVVSMFVLLGLTGYLTSTHGPILFACVMLPLVLPCCSIQSWFFAEMKRFREALQELSRVSISDCSEARLMVFPAIIGPLLEIVAVAPIQTYEGLAYEDMEPAIGLLSTLLRSVQADDEVTLTESQRKLLHEFAITTRSYRENWYIRAKSMWEANTQVFDRICRQLRPDAICALGLLGNRSSLTVLERFAKTTDDPDLRQSALRSAEQIRERMRYGADQLLRAGIAPESPETLLRATFAETPPNTDPRQLLRAEHTVQITTRMDEGSIR